MPVNLETLRVMRGRLVATDPGLVRLRVATWAVLGIAVAAVVQGALHQPLQVTLVAAVAAMQSAFTVNDNTRGAQAVTLVLSALSGAAALTVAAFGSFVPMLNYILFILLIFVAVYVQRFTPRGGAVGSLPFFMFFFGMYLDIQPAKLPQYLAALGVGMASHALVRFLVIPHRRAAELLRVRRAFRARLGAVVRVAAAELASGGSDRRRAALRRADARLHETVLMIEDSIADVLEPTAAEMLRRRALEVELAAQWLSITTQRATAVNLPEDVRNELVVRLLRLDSLIENDPRELPVLSGTDEFSRMLVAGSPLGERSPGDQVRQAIAELALADVNAQRIAEHDYSAEAEAPESPPERTRVFAFDNRTRAAVQAMVAGGLAVLGGELISHQRWYWAVLTVFVVFLNTVTAGATVAKGVRRVAGTLVGIFGGMLLALVASGHTVATVALLMLCVFGMVYTVRTSQLVGSFFITCLLGLLYSLLGTFSIEVLWVRVLETAVGAAAGLVAAMAVLPVHTQAVLRSDLRGVLDSLRTLVTGADDLLAGRENVNVIELSRALDRAIEKVHTTLEPLTHPINVVSRRYYTSYLLGALYGIGFRSRNVAARAEPGVLAGDDRLPTLVARIDHNIDVIGDVIDNGTTRRRLDRDPDAPALRETDDAEVGTIVIGLDRLDEWIIALGRALGAQTAEDAGPRREFEPPPAVTLLSKGYVPETDNSRS